MAVSVTGVLRAINKLSEPLQKKVMKKLGLSMDDLPGRTSKTAGINVGKERVKRKEVRDQIAGSMKTIGVGTAGLAAYTAGDFINDLLGIKKAGKGSQFTKEELARFRQRKAAASETKATKKPTRKLTKDDMPTLRPKKKMFMKERSGKDSKVEFGTGKAKTKLSTGGATGLKKIRADQPGLKALKKKAPQVVRNMGYLRKGSLVTKKKTKGGSKGGKGILVVSIGVGKMAKKKPTTKKKTTKKTKRG